MRLKIFVAAAFFVALPIVAFAQSDKPNAQSLRPTIEDAQKLVDTISGDKEKLKVYCEIGKLDEQLDQADEKGDPTAFEDLVAKRDSLEQQLGPDYIRVIDGLGDWRATKLTVIPGAKVSSTIRTFSDAVQRQRR
jgi:hypothetical protein